MRRVVTSARAKLRLDAAAAWLTAHGVAEEVLVIGASQAAAAETIREVAQLRGSGFGWHRMTLGRLATELAKHALVDRGLVPVGMTVIEAMCARVVQRLGAASLLGRLAAVAEQPGLPRALARTLVELRMARATQVAADPVIDAALRGLGEELGRAKLADRATVYELAIAATRATTTTHPLLGLPTLLIDVPLRSNLEQLLVGAILAQTPHVLATIPDGDTTTAHYLAELGAPEVLEVDAANALGRVQRNLFERGRLTYAELDSSIEIFSAPGESRECVELARRVIKAAESGIAFDRMAVVLRTPNQYRAHLEEAMGRAGVPVQFEQGTVRPDPSGRAFLALLACAAEKLSARRFGEYVSLGEVPDARDGEPPAPLPAAERWVAPDEELSPIAPQEEIERPRGAVDAGAVAGGTLRAPWRWERLLVEAAVIGGRDRWERRLGGLQKRLELDDAESGREGRKRALEDLGHLRKFALPLLDDLTALPHEAHWGEWIDRLTALATRALREPVRVLSVLSELVPMSEVGPVGLREVQLVLQPRLAELIVKPAQRRYGRLLVAPVDAIRGLSFEVVFVPGLAERMFPQKVVEDPLLLDPVREVLDLGLATRERRISDERLALRLAIGAARGRAVLSYPRIDLEQGRPRVPSFYGLEVLEAAEGALPGFDELGRKADATGAARIGWPAPADRMTAIDEAEHDLALLDGHLRPGVAAETGVAAYLLATNPHLGRSLRSRARRWTISKWLAPDGLIATTIGGHAALAAHQVDVRSFSPTALEQLAQCPYRFALRSIVKLEPRQQPEPIETLGPLERGSLIHDIHFELMGELREAGLLPVPSLDAVRERIDTVIARVAARYRDDLCPAIDRVWDDGIAVIGADIREWVRRMVEDPVWTPRRFELAFGLPGRDARDPASVDAPVDLGIGLTLRGSIDLVEEDAGLLRATDYKTGLARIKTDIVINGGTTLQPALYALVLEKLFANARVAGGRLYFCTSRGEFKTVDVALDDRVRDAVQQLAHTLDDHLKRGFFPAAPVKDACAYCDFRPICGPYEENRVRDKLEREPLVQLRRLREMP